MPQREIVFIGTGCGWGAANMGTAKGPHHLFTHPLSPSCEPFSTFFTHPFIFQNFHEEEGETSLFPLDAAGQTVRKRKTLQALNHHFTATHQTLTKGFFPFSIGGDHSLAIATWSAVKKVYPEFGLIWIDAHLDAHTPHTSLSHALHGMPLAVLLGYGYSELTQLTGEKPVLAPKNVAYIGVRSFEDKEYQLLTRLGVKIYLMEEVNARGFATVYKEAQHRVTQNTPYYGISLDIDAFDPLEIPGTGAPVSGGLKEDLVLPSLISLVDDENLIAFEVVEFNPDLDEDNKTLSFLWRLITTVIGEEKW